MLRVKKNNGIVCHIKKSNNNVYIERNIRREGILKSAYRKNHTYFSKFQVNIPEYGLSIIYHELCALEKNKYNFRVMVKN